MDVGKELLQNGAIFLQRLRDLFNGPSKRRELGLAGSDEGGDGSDGSDGKLTCAMVPAAAEARYSDTMRPSGTTDRSHTDARRCIESSVSGKVRMPAPSTFVVLRPTRYWPLVGWDC